MNTIGTTAERIKKLQKGNQEALNKLHRMKDEEKIFIAIQKYQCGVLDDIKTFEFDGYNINSDFIRGEFHFMFEQNVFRFYTNLPGDIHSMLKEYNYERPENEQGTFLVSGKSDIIKKYKS